MKRKDRIRVVNIIHQTTVDGPGFRTSIYCAGCLHHCAGCHNPETWDFGAGRWMSVDELFEIVKADDLSDVTFSGGDPFYQAEAFAELARRIKTETDKTVWCWTGFTIEEIWASKEMSALLEWVDVLVDGPFVIERKTTELPWRGSDNQRVIHLKEAPDDKKKKLEKQ